MARNYTLRTIKLLFGQASSCAHPDCNMALVYSDRGQDTVVAEIAHIRSAAPAGPRRDLTYAGDLDGPDNLLLLCGTHHKAVDRHEASYSVEELEVWKQAQVASGGDGTTIADVEAARYIRLTSEERTAIDRLARIAYRLEQSAKSASGALGSINDEYQSARSQGYAAMGLVYEVDDEGNKSRLPPGSYNLPQVEINKFQRRFDEEHRQQQDRVREIAAQLGEEVSVLRMMDGQLGEVACEALISAASIVDEFDDADKLAANVAALQATLRTVYETARDRF